MPCSVLQLRPFLRARCHEPRKHPLYRRETRSFAKLLTRGFQPLTHARCLLFVPQRALQCLGVIGRIGFNIR